MISARGRAAGVLFLFLMATMTLGADLHQQVDAGEIIYVNAERTFETRVSGSTWTIGPILALKPLPSQTKSNLFTESIGHPIVDCSDSIVRCVRSWSRTLAVPRAGVKPRETYRKDGVVFDVEECLRGDTERCQVALVSATCWHRSDGEMCDEKTEAHGGSSANVEYVVYFIYNNDFGITALGVANRVATTPAARRGLATQSVLISSRGLLKE
jgi:hypothetical protein